MTKLNLTPKTLRAIKKYGIEACNRAYEMNEAGYGASSIALEGPTSIRTTQQANAAINAGREIDSSSEA